MIITLTSLPKAPSAALLRLSRGVSNSLERCASTAIDHRDGDEGESARPSVVLKLAGGRLADLSTLCSRMAFDKSGLWHQAHEAATAIVAARRDAVQVGQRIMNMKEAD